jgi:hypothetical protein
MSIWHRQDVERQRAACRWVCLLLAFFFLYNPFLALPHAPGKISVSHPPSYRATIAHSELSQFLSTKQIPSAAKAVYTVVAFIVLLAAPQSIRAPRVTVAVLWDEQPLLCGNVWFRPPPIA